jgi:hypothetical protein
LGSDWLSEFKGNDRFRIAGIKIFADGAIGSATAAIYGKYSGVPTKGPVLTRKGGTLLEVADDGREVSGQLIYSPDRLKSMIRTAHDAGNQVSVHTIGDYATDLVMDGMEGLTHDLPHRIEHAMLLSDAQIDRMANLGVFCTMQPEFLIRFAHAYRAQLGPQRSAKLKRFRSVLDAGIPLSFSSDRPIVAGDPVDGIRTAVNRPFGFDASENVSLREALLAYTDWGHAANGDSPKPLASLDPRYWQVRDFSVVER